jgi:hypothetical protein
LPSEQTSVLARRNSGGPNDYHLSHLQPHSNCCSAASASSSSTAPKNCDRVVVNSTALSLTVFTVHCPNSAQLTTTKQLVVAAPCQISVILLLCPVGPSVAVAAVVSSWCSASSQLYSVIVPHTSLSPLLLTLLLYIPATAFLFQPVLRCSALPRRISVKPSHIARVSFLGSVAVLHLCWLPHQRQAPGRCASPSHPHNRPCHP